MKKCEDTSDKNSYTCTAQTKYLIHYPTRLNPIRSGGGGSFKSPSPIFCLHTFNFGATLLCVGDFTQKIV